MSVHASYDRESWFSKVIGNESEGSNEDDRDFEQQVREMLSNGRLCSWVSVKGGEYDDRVDNQGFLRDVN